MAKKKPKKLLGKASSRSKASMDEKIKEDKKISGIVKELEAAFVKIRFYPVASSEKEKNEARKKILSQYKKGDNTSRQLILYMFHENLAHTAGMKLMQNFEFFKRKFPNIEPPKVRMQVYRAMFHYDNSLEGVIELVGMLGEMEGDDAAKLLSYHLSFSVNAEFEINHILRNAIIEALGESNSLYSLNVLMSYAKYAENEKMLQRIAAALSNWNRKIDTLKIPEREKEKVRRKLDEVLTSEFMGSHYG